MRTAHLVSKLCDSRGRGCHVGIRVEWGYGREALVNLKLHRRPRNQAAACNRAVLLERVRKLPEIARTCIMVRRPQICALVSR